MTKNAGEKASLPQQTPTNVLPDAMETGQKRRVPIINISLPVLNIAGAGSKRARATVFNIAILISGARAAAVFVRFTGDFRRRCMHYIPVAIVAL